KRQRTARTPKPVGYSDVPAAREASWSARSPLPLLVLTESSSHACFGRLLIAFCLALILATGFRAMAENAPAAFEAANRLYLEEKYSEAATTYGILEQSGHKSAALYFNWGNALFKSQQLGR